MQQKLIATTIFFCALITSGCSNSKPVATSSSKAEGTSEAKPQSAATEADARKMMMEFLKPNANIAKLSQKLRPSKDDYTSVFDTTVAAKAEAGYSKAWDAGQIELKPKPNHVDVLLKSATTEDFQAWNQKAIDFPSEYKKVAKHLKPGITVYALKFVQQGSAIGMAYDGLVFVNGHWVIFPKVWRVLE